MQNLTLQMLFNFACLFGAAVLAVVVLLADWAWAAPVIMDDMTATLANKRDRDDKIRLSILHPCYQRLRDKTCQIVTVR